MQQRPKSAEEARAVLENLPTDEDMGAEVKQAHDQSMNEVKALLEELQQTGERSRKLYEVFRSEARNKFLRRAALVEYRCVRGCFLGAVLPHDGERWIATRKNYGFHPFPIGDTGDAELRYPATPGEAWQNPEIEWGYARNDYAITTWEQFVKVPKPSVYSSSHCAHTSCQFVPEEIEADIRRLRRKDKRVVRLPRAHS